MVASEIPASRCGPRLGDVQSFGPHAWLRAAAIAGAVLTLSCGTSDSPSPEQAAAIVRASTVPAENEQGAALYAERCAPCHGAHGEGSDEGPPMLHPLQARHHGDFAFRRAVREGVAPHHYRFGTMPPVAGLGADELDAIVGYVRWMQRTAGLR